LLPFPFPCVVVVVAQECYQDFRLSTVTGEQQYIKASARYFCVGMFGGGGPVVVNRLDRPGRFDDISSPYLAGHSGAVNDFDWNPFDDSMLATASDDTNIKVWQIPDEWEPIDASGNAKKGTNITESAADLTGHTKKVTLLRFHPTASNTLMSTGADYTVKIWDVESSADVVTFDDVPNLVHDLVWDARGDMAAFSCKDKNVRVIDPRTAAETHKFQAHDGVKSVKLFYVHDTGKIVTCGASKTSSREIRIWDLKDLSKPLHTEPVDSAAGAMIPLWDPDTSVFYLCGKGDGIVRIYEYEEKAPFIYKLNDGFRSNIPGKGYCLVPKRGLNVMQHETARVLKVTNNAGVHPLSFHVPRKSDAFQEDIFPPTASSIPSHSFSEWMGGSSKGPVTLDLSPAANGGAANGHSNGAHANGHSNGGAVKKVFKSSSTLSHELDEARKRIEFLEAKLAENGIAF
jgi:coronin-1B/1C/6